MARRHGHVCLGGISGGRGGYALLGDDEEEETMETEEVDAV